MERWGYEYFDDENQVPVGVEIEDNGRNGIVEPHYEGHLFGNEIMYPTDLKYRRISNVTLAVFEDTEWYMFNWYRAESLE
jgi:hypothetical protein